MYGRVTKNVVVIEAPESYSRTEAFLRSAVKVDAKMKGNKCVASVYIDLDSMNDCVNATGYQVAQWADTGSHEGIPEPNEPEPKPEEEPGNLGNILSFVRKNVSPWTTMEDILQYAEVLDSLMENQIVAENFWKRKINFH